MPGRYWIEYHHTDLSGQLSPALGTEAFQPLDGRLSLESAHAEAQNRAYLMRKVHKYEGYRIMRGNRPSTAKPVTKVVKLERFQDA